MKLFYAIVLSLSIININGFAQENDNCANAIALTVDVSCKISVFSNQGASAEGPEIAPEPSCGVYNGGDVWFTAIMPTSGALRIETDNLAGATPHSITLYSGICGDLTEVYCIRQDHNRTIYNPSLAGLELYIRVFSLNGTPGSDFELCVWEPEIPVNDNCENAILLVAGESCQVEIYSNAYATAQPVEIAPDPDCGAYMGGDVWFKTMVPTSGQLRIETKNLQGSTPKSIVIYSGNCGALTEIFCNDRDNEENFYDPDWAGKWVYIRIFNFLTEEGGPFELCLWDPVLPVNDNCQDAVEVVVGESCTPNEYTNALATSQPESIASEPACGVFMGGDVWFKAVVPTSGNLSVKTKNLMYSSPKSVVIYAGTCGSFTEIFCNKQEELSAFSDPNLVGQTVYIRIFDYLTEEGSPFELCITDNPCPVIDTSVTQNGQTLSALNDHASYQWIICDDENTPIDGEIGQSFEVHENGNFAVMISESGCTEISDCHEVHIVGLPNTKESAIRVFPNPVQKALQIEVSQAYERVSYELLNVNGQSLHFNYINNQPFIKLNMNQHLPGIYFLKINTGSSFSITKLIKE